MQRRAFKHLNSEQIKGIIELHIQQVPKLKIAERFKIDNSTVHYHINKYLQASDDIDSSEFYSIVKVAVREECCHPSMKCSLCGKFKDNVLSEQNRKILSLQTQLSNYKRRYGNL